MCQSGTSKGFKGIRTQKAAGEICIFQRQESILLSDGLFPCANEPDPKPTEVYGQPIVIYIYSTHGAF